LLLLLDYFLRPASITFAHLTTKAKEGLEEWEEKIGWDATHFLLVNASVLRNCFITQPSNGDDKRKQIKNNIAVRCV